MLTSSDLSLFTGSETVCRWSRLFFKHWATEGALHVCKECAAYWLLDAVASHHNTMLRRDRRCGDFQLWTLQKRNGGAVLRGFADSEEKAVVSQNIEFTDFFSNYGEEVFRLYVSRCEHGWVVMLPTEY